MKRLIDLILITSKERLLVLGFLLIPFLFFFSSSSTAQSKKSTNYHKRDGHLAAAGFHVGYFRPIMYYYNSIYLNESESQLDGGLTFGTVIDYYINNDVYLRVGLDYSGQNLTTENVFYNTRTRDDIFTISAFHGSIIAYKELDFKAGIKPYIGLGVGVMRGRVEHQVSYESSDTVYTNTGYPIYGIVTGGVNYMISETLDIGVELRLYWPPHHRDYNTVDLGGTTTTLSYSGPSALFRLAYRYDSFINRDRLGARRRHMRRPRGR